MASLISSRWRNVMDKSTAFRSLWLQQRTGKTLSIWSIPTKAWLTENSSLTTSRAISSFTRRWTRNRTRTLSTISHSHWVKMSTRGAPPLLSKIARLLPRRTLWKQEPTSCASLAMIRSKSHRGLLRTIRSTTVCPQWGSPPNLTCQALLWSKAIGLSLPDSRSPSKVTTMMPSF